MSENTTMEATILCDYFNMNKLKHPSLSCNLGFLPLCGSVGTLAFQVLKGWACLEKRCASLPLIAKFSQAKGFDFSLLMFCRENLINGDLWGSSQEGYMPDFPNSSTAPRILSPALS